MSDDLAKCLEGLFFGWELGCLIFQVFSNNLTSGDCSMEVIFARGFLWSYRNNPTRIDRQDVVTKSKVAGLPKRGCTNVELSGFFLC